MDGKEPLADHITSGLRDVWMLQQETKTSTVSNGFTFSTLDTELTKRIDIIFMREYKSVIFNDVKVLDTGQRKNEALSDHLPILANFDMMQP